MSIAEVRDQMANKVLTANRAYQRGAGLWPVSAKSYFTDTLMNEDPFQSVYIHEYISRDTKVVGKDIVDGQQRLTTIFDFLNDDFHLVAVAGSILAESLEAWTTTFGTES